MGDRSRGVLVVLAAAALLVAGCSSSDPEPGDEPGSDVTADAGSAEGSSTTTDGGSGGSDTSAAASPAEGVTDLEIVDFSFQPEETRVEAGTTLTWTNDDDATHTTTSEDEVWASGDLEPGAGFSVTIDEPGTYPYVCSIHSFMAGTVVVG